MNLLIFFFLQYPHITVLKSTQFSTADKTEFVWWQKLDPTLICLVAHYMNKLKRTKEVENQISFIFDKLRYSGVTVPAKEYTLVN